MPNYYVTITVRDAKDKQKAMTAHGTFADDAAALVRATELYPLVGDLTLGQIAKVELTKVISVSGTIPVGNIDVERYGTFTFRHAQGFNTRLSIPAFNDDTYAENTTNEILVDEIAVAAFTAEIIAGGWTDYRWSDITQLVEAKMEG
jgi:hypothetical protein